MRYVGLIIPATVGVTVVIDPLDSASGTSWICEPPRIPCSSALPHRPPAMVERRTPPAHRSVVRRRTSIAPAARGRPGPGPDRTGSHPHRLRARTRPYRVGAPWADSLASVRRNMSAVTCNPKSSGHADVPLGWASSGGGRRSGVAGEGCRKLLRAGRARRRPSIVNGWPRTWNRSSTPRS